MDQQVTLQFEPMNDQRMPKPGSLLQVLEPFYLRPNVTVDSSNTISFKWDDYKLITKKEMSTIFFLDAQLVLLNNSMIVERKISYLQGVLTGEVVFKARLLTFIADDRLLYWVDFPVDFFGKTDHYREEPNNLYVFWTHHLFFKNLKLL